MPSSTSAIVTLPTDEQILITREFDAPRHLVWRAWTTPDLVMRWWCGERGTMRIVDMDFQVGGTWRYVMDAAGGHEVGFHGEYREIVPEERIVNTEIYEGAPESGAALNITTFAEDDGRTTLELLTIVDSREIRDMILQSGMEGGMQEQMDRLEQVAISLA
jgi:uncharacterized protein YndB with AHSA1/START domain